MMDIQHVSQKVRSLTLGIALAAFFCAPSLVHAEIIRSFTSDIVVSKDATLEVKETVVYDFGDAERHGIFRTIPFSHPEKSTEFLKERYTEIDDIRVLRDDAVEPYTKEDTHTDTTIRIGDPDSTISGIHSYEISYVVRGALSYPTAKQPELYWNVTGNDWEVPIYSARAVIHDPDNILESERSCYRGVIGSNASCVAVATTTGAIFTASNLDAGEGMTIANATKLGIAKVELSRFRYDYLVLFIVVPLLLMGVGYFVSKMFAYNTKYYTHKTVVAQYEPYEGILPMYTGYLIDGRLGGSDITAGIVYLAEQGYIRISAVERKAFIFFDADDYEVELLKQIPDNMPEYAGVLVGLLFDAPIVGSKVSLHELAHNVAKQRENHTQVTALESAIERELITKGFYERAQNTFSLSPKKLVALLAVFAIAVSAFQAAFSFSEAWKILLAVIVLCCTGLLFAVTMLSRRQTAKGYEAVNYLAGYSLYLSVAEKDRINFHNAPEKSPQEFLAHLPYAIAFGVEEKWAKVFKDVTIPAPEWYRDASGANLNAAAFAHSFSTLSTALSSSAGTSASSGGGSSGGGGGGGGGGSW